MLVQLLSSLGSASKKYSDTIYATLASFSLVALCIFLWAWRTRRAADAHLKNLRRVGVQRSNLADQYDAKFGISEGASPIGPTLIKALFLHPVKSCAPVEVDRAILLKRGFKYDRCLAIATQKTAKAGKDSEEAPEWRFISQRTKPMMAQIMTEIWVPHEESDPRDPLVQAAGCVVLRFRDPDEPSSWVAKLQSPDSMVSFTVPLQPTPEEMSKNGLGVKPFGIHDRTAMGLDLSAIPSVAEAMPKLKAFLKIPDHHGLTIFNCTDDTLVQTNGNLAPLEHIGTPSVHGYTDDQPININNLASVHAVSSLLPPENRPLNALRFRANLWVTGNPAFEEETWKRFRIVPRDGRKGSDPQAPRVVPTISAVCRTSRCTMPNVDPEKGVVCTDDPPPGKTKGKPQPSTTMVKHRKIDDGNKGALGFIGMHCVPEDRSLAEASTRHLGLVVEVGDEIEVLERGLHYFGSTANEY